MSPSDVDRTVPDDGPERKAGREASRSEIDKETSAIERPDLSQPAKDSATTDKTMLSGPTEDLVPGYQMVSKLGEGGMGVVYKAVQRSLNREVALKVMKNLGEDESFVARFRREAITGARLNHPNIVGVYDHGKHQGSVYLVLEFVRGKNCAEILDEQKRFSIKDALEIIRCATLGLSHAHNEGVIHRDIKPANIMVVEGNSGDARRGRRLVAKVADFGLARMHDGAGDPDHQDLTQAGSVMGTPGYMAPEQALGKPVDFRADIYSLGSTLYCLLTGTKPFHGNTVIEVLHKKINDFAIDPRDIVGEMPDGVVRVIDRMMAKSADDRYQSYENLLHDLEKVLAGQEPETLPVEAHSRSIAPPAGKTIAVEHQHSSRGAESSIFLPAPGSGKKWAIIGAAVVAVGAATAFALLGGSSPGEGSSSGTDLKAIETKLADWKKADSVAFLAEATGHWQELSTALTGADGAAAQSLREDFVARLVADLRARSTAIDAELESLWRQRDWQTLAARVQTLTAIHEVASVDLALRTKELAGFAAAALAGDAASAERLGAGKILAGEGGQAELQSFLTRFPFSPDRGPISDRLEQLRSATAIGVEISARLKELEAVAASDFFSATHDLGDTAKKIAGIGDDSLRRRLETEFIAIRRLKGEELLSTSHASLDEMFLARKFDTMAVQVEKMLGICQSVNIDPPEWLTAHAANVKAATPAMVTRELTAWNDIEKAKDPVVLVELLEDYIEKYQAISPVLEEARSKLEAARSEVPEFSLMVDPADARIRIEGKLKPGPEVKVRLKTGTVQVVVEADGYYAYERMFDHKAGAMPHVIHLSPMPSRKLSVAPSSFNTLQLFVPRGAGLESRIQPSDCRGCSVSLDDANARIKLEPRKSSWGYAEKELLFGRGFDRGAKFDGWQLRGIVEVIGGETEVRVLETGPQMVVIGLEEAGYYFGLRDGDKLEKRFEFPYPTEAAALRFALEWQGDVVQLKVTPGEDSLKSTADLDGVVVGSMRLDRMGSLKSKLGLAVRASGDGEQSGARFGDFELHPLTSN